MEPDQSLAEASGVLPESAVSRSMAPISSADEETRQITLFVEAVSQFSSEHMTDRYRAQLNSLRAMNQLMEMTRKEMLHYKQMAVEFKEITTNFQYLVWDLQRTTSKLYRHLDAVNIQFNMLVEILLDLEQPLNDITTQNDVNLCLEGLEELG